MIDQVRFKGMFEGMFPTGKPEEMVKLEGKRSNHQDTDQTAADAANRESGVMFSHEDGPLGGPKGIS